MWCSIVLSLIVILVIKCFFYLKRKFKYWEDNGVPQNTFWGIMSFQGMGLFSRDNFTEVFQRQYDLSADAKYVGVYEITRPTVFVKDPQLIKLITIKDFDHWTNRAGGVNLEELEDFDPLFLKNLSSLRDDKWKRMRTILSPAFTLSKMRSMYSLLSECGRNFVEAICQESTKNNNVFDTKDAFRRYTADAIASCAFGISLNSMKDKDNQFYTYGVELTNLRKSFLLKFMLMKTCPKLVKFLGIRVTDERVEAFFIDVIKTTMAKREKEGITRPDMLQLLMDSREMYEDLTITNITSQAFIFYFAGFDTSSVLLSFAAHEIAKNPQVKIKLQEEIDKVMEEAKGEPTYEAVTKATYLEAVINETLRMYPPAPMLFRLCTKDYELPPTLPNSKPIKVAKGSNALIPTYQLHRDPRYFENPNVFNPDRFLNGQAEESPAYMPFGLGPRMCIANRFALLQVKTALFHLLSKCDISPCEKTQPEPMEYSKKIFQLAPKMGFWLKIEPRV